MNLEAIQEKLVNYVVTNGPNVIWAIIILFVGFWFAKRISKLVAKGLGKRNIDPSLTPYVVSVLSASIKAVVVISAIGRVGIQTTSFAAVLGAAGLAVGLALQGSLSNFAGGVLILLFKPFKVGDYIAAQGTEGTVKEIQIFHTTLTSPDGKKVILPNGTLSNDQITNYSAGPARRVEFKFGIGYGSSMTKAKEAIQSIIDNHEMTLKDPAPLIAVSNHGASSVDFTVRVWCKTDDYWDVYFYYPEKVKDAFDKAGIEIPFPQMDVHMISQAS